MFLNTKYDTKLRPVKYLENRQLLHFQRFTEKKIDYCKKFWKLEYQGKKVIVVVGCRLFSGKIIVWNLRLPSKKQQDCRAKCKLPCKSPDSTAKDLLILPNLSSWVENVLDSGIQRSRERLVKSRERLVKSRERLVRSRERLVLPSSG